MISNNCINFRCMEFYPKQMDGTLHIIRYVHDAVYRPFFGVHLDPPKITTVIP